MSRGRTLVAGLGNVFFGDDGFGVEVVSRLLRRELPGHVHVEDFGIRGVHLVYELLDGYDTVVLVDTVPRDEEPGTVFVLEPEPGASLADLELGSPVVDAHGMEPHVVLSMVEDMGGSVGRVVIVGCEPASVGDGMGLSEPVAGAVNHAVDAVVDLVTSETATVEQQPT